MNDRNIASLSSLVLSGLHTWRKIQGETTSKLPYLLRMCYFPMQYSLGKSIQVNPGMYLRSSHNGSTLECKLKVIFISENVAVLLPEFIRCTR